MYQQKIDEAKRNMQKSIEFLQNEFSKLKAGKINSGMIEDLAVDYYGTPTPLKQLASIGSTEPRVLVVKPYDKGSLKAIETSISTSDLGLTSNVDQDVVRVIAPELTEERRTEMAKMVSQKAEEAKVIVRNAREKALKDIKDMEISEDDSFKAQEELDKLAGENNKEIKELEDKKAKEIMTV